MAEATEKLVREITDQVMTALRGGGPVTIRPPAGTCTGDYSKFKEAPGVQTSVAAQERPRRGTAQRPLSGVITAASLMKREGVVHITPSAKLTPLAMDYAKENRLAIERMGVHAGQTSCGVAKALVTAERAVAGQAAVWTWWCDGHEPNVARVTDQLRARIKPLTHQRSAGALVEAIKRLAQRVRRGEAAGGVLFVASAAQAACLANRCRSLRAVVGTCADAVQQGIEQLAANVLIIEHPYQGWRTMRAMVETFIGSPRPANAEIQRKLQELAECE